MNEVNQKATEGTALTQEEIATINQANNICQMKLNDINRAKIEYRMLTGSLKTYINGLLIQYNLDMSKQYEFNGSALVEVVPPETEEKSPE